MDLTYFSNLGDPPFTLTAARRAIQELYAVSNKVLYRPLRTNYAPQLAINGVYDILQVDTNAAGTRILGVGNQRQKAGYAPDYHFVRHPHTAVTPWPIIYTPSKNMVITDLTSPPESPKCECGAEKCGSTLHSNWCPKRT